MFLVWQFALLVHAHRKIATQIVVYVIPFRSKPLPLEFNLLSMTSCSKTAQIPLQASHPGLACLWNTRKKTVARGSTRTLSRHTKPYGGTAPSPIILPYFIVKSWNFDI